MVVHKNSQLLNMDGFFVFVDNDIQEDELKALQKKIKRMQKRKQTKQNKETETSSSMSSRTSSPPAESLKPDLTEASTDAVDRSRSSRCLNGCENSGAAVCPKLEKKKRKLHSREKSDTAKKRRVEKYLQTDTTASNSSKKSQSFSQKTPRFSNKQFDQDFIASSSRPWMVQTLTKQITRVRALSCLTRCKSCAVYRPPALPEEDRREMANYVALDCEFVGVGPKKKSALGRCSIVDHNGAILFDRFVKPEEPITDYRTPWSGLRPKDIRKGIPFIAAKEQISTVIKDKVVIGHAVHNDFHVMELFHPPHMIRDTASCKQLRQMANLGHGSCALRSLTQALLGRQIQTGEHCSVTDARAALDLFRLVRATWEPALKAKLSRRQARLNLDTGRTSDDPDISSYLEDHYWPPGLFVD